MPRRKENIVKQLTLLKLANWTYSYKFTVSSVKVSFIKLLAFVVNKLCFSLSVWTEFIGALHLDKDILTGLETPMETGKDVRIVRKRYSVKKRSFSSTISFKYLLMAEICCIYSLFEKDINDEQMKQLCIWLHITKKTEDFIIECIENYLDPDWLPTVKNGKWKGVAETILPLGEFIRKEKIYYQLPKKNVSMFSTMSAGKSTFVNALLGQDYLPSQNKVCTAKVASISDIDHISYCLGYAIKNRKYIFCNNVDQNKIMEWNNDSRISEIMLEGNLDRISSKIIVTIIHDTPGINYSGNTDHKKITLKHLLDSKPDVIICLLDATQMLTTDFSNALEDLKKTNKKESRAQVLFVLNKADSYDSEKESLKEAITDTLEELEKHGFNKPIVVPVSSLAARLFKKALHGRSNFTENERDDFSRYVRFFSRPENNFRLLAEGVSGKILQDTAYKTKRISKITLEGKSYERDLIVKALFNTGIPVIEYFLNAQGGKANDDRNNFKV